MTPDGATAPSERVHVRALYESVRAATRWLEANRERINALNVFPVPDGDTGNNMVSTMRGALRALESASPTCLAEVADALSMGALNASRGNSGVILSQMLSGFAAVLRETDELTPDVLARAFRRAAQEGYKAHSEPVEGTMMTVARDVADEAERRAAEGLPLRAFITSLVTAARASVARTQFQLPRLEQAGVVDAGGEGIAVLLDGTVRWLSGERTFDSVEPVNSADLTLVDLSEDDAFGYCTNFMVRGSGLDLEGFRRAVVSLGTSALVVGTPEVIKVHVHTEQPGEIISLALSLGTLHEIKIDNMDDQFRETMALQQPAQPPPAQTAVVAVASGAGLVRLFQRAGALVVAGGQSMNPSTGDLLQAVEKAGAEQVLILPNNSNVVMSAQQAASRSAKLVEVLPTESVPEGLVAMLSYERDQPLDRNLEQMAAAVASVTSLEVTRAVRDAASDSLTVREGQYIGLVEGKLRVAADTVLDCIRELLRTSEGREAELLTLFSGEGIERDEVDSVLEALGTEFPDVRLEHNFGGQPHYMFIGALE